METNNKPHRLAGEPAASFNMDLRNCRAALLLIWFFSGRPSFHADEGHFFGQLRNQSRVLDAVDSSLRYLHQSKKCNFNSWY
jgi:hypothetical protein